MRPFPNYLQLDELPAKENISSEGASTADVSEAHPSNSVSKNCNQNYEVYNGKLNVYTFNQVNIRWLFK